MGGSAGSPMGKTYLSTGVTEDGRPKELVAKTRVRLEFAVVPNENDEGPRVYDVLRVFAGCNRLGAAVATGELLADGKLWIDGFGGTARGCDPPLQAQDEWLTGFLISRPSWQVNGDELTLTSAGTTITLLDRKIAEPDFPLDGIRWKLVTTITNGDLFHYHHRAEEAWVTFDGDRLTGWTGCNELSGTVTRSTSELTFTDVVTTDRAPIGQTAEVETAILTTLSANVTYAIDHNRLTLIAPTGIGLDLTAVR
ncbi:MULTISPECIES: META domain-containing protein [unclassified Kribbella]|uniref:META domain-containing protein n=1 Tax=unclassified Kribbella TaxID=2644121 RepID=UPI00301607A4